MHACPHCGLQHYNSMGVMLTCPRIKSIEYYPDGTQKRVEFHAPQPIIGSFDVPPLGAISERKT